MQADTAGVETNPSNAVIRSTLLKTLLIAPTRMASAVESLTQSPPTTVIPSMYESRRSLRIADYSRERRHVISFLSPHLEQSCSSADITRESGLQVIGVKKFDRVSMAMHGCLQEPRFRPLSFSPFKILTSVVHARISPSRTLMR